MVQIPLQMRNTKMTDGVEKVATEDAICTREDILNFLSQNSKIFFKSQQIDDPELTVHEKKTIAESIFNESHQRFLSRFGKYLEQKHLNYFENVGHFNGDDEEIRILLKELRKDLANRSKNIKNRRYSALQSMISNQSYFSEKEMMRREPALYEELVGQYLTDGERKARDNFDVENAAFSSILLEGIDKERTEELRKKQEQEQEEMSDEEDGDSTRQSFASTRTNQTLGADEFYPKTPASFRKQWGNFEDEVSAPPGMGVGITHQKRSPKPQKYVTASEREMLRQEFVGIMYAKFLDGEDKDFDYTKVDENADLDDLDQIGRDVEEKYFEEDDDNEADDRSIRNFDIEFEDELDVYMKNLQKNPT